MNKLLHMPHGIFTRLLFACAVLLFAGCGDDYNVVGVNSPQPGTLRVILQADESDDFLVVGADTVKTEEGSPDSLAMAVGQGRAYRGGDFAILYKTLQDYQEVTKFLNPIRRQGGRFTECLLFETALPPATYDSMKIALTANVLKLGLYSIPLAPVADALPLAKFAEGFRIEEGRVTVVHLQLKPFASLQRVQDTYQYDWKIVVSRVEYR